MTAICRTRVVCSVAVAAAIMLSTLSLGTNSVPGLGAVAYAGEQDGVCDYYSWGYGDLCLFYYRRGTTSSLSDFYIGDPSLWDNRFLSPAWGQFEVVANNSMSVWNRDSRYFAWVCNGQNYVECGPVYPGDYYDFNPVSSRNVESLYWLPPSVSTRLIASASRRGSGPPLVSAQCIRSMMKTPEVRAGLSQRSAVLWPWTLGNSLDGQGFARPALYQNVHRTAGKCPTG